MEGKTPDNHGSLNVGFQYSSSCHRGKDPYSGSVCPPSGCLCCEGGGPLVNMGPLKLFSSSVLIGIDLHSGSVYPHSGCLCYEGMDQYSSSCHWGKDPHSCSVCPPSGCLCCEGGGGGLLVNMGLLKLFSSIVLFGIDPHSGSVYPHSGCLCNEGMEGGLQDCTGHYRKKSERDVVALRDFLTSNCSTSIRVWTCTKCSWSDDRLPLGYFLPKFQQI